MNAQQQQVLLSFVRVRVFLDERPMSGSIDSRHARAMLDDAMRRVREHVTTQESARALGRAASRRQQELVRRIRDEHMRPMVTIARAQTEPGADVGLPVALRMPTGKLGLQEFVQWCDGMLELARPFEALFVSNGMPADFLVRFARARAELVESTAVRATLTTAHVSARRGLQVELRRARLAVDRLDAIVRANLCGDEAMLSVWRSTKRVHKLTGGAAMPSQRKASLPESRHASSHDVEVPHHAGRVMLEDVAMVHPAAGPVVGEPRDAHAAEGADVHGVVPSEPVDGLAVHLEHLEEEAVQVEGVVDGRAIADVPDLQLADAHRVGVMVLLPVDVELDAVPEAEAEAEPHVARWRDRARHERVDGAQPIRHARHGWRGGAHAQRGEPLRLAV